MTTYNQQRKPFALTPTQNTPRRPSLTSAEMDERRLKGLCFWCPEKFTSEHKCLFRRNQVYTMEVQEVEGEITESTTLSTEDEEHHEEGLTMALISACALGGVESFQTMRVIVTRNKKPLHALIDSGSSHNFLNIEMARKIGCHLEKVQPIEISVADRSSLKCEWMCKSFTWQLKQAIFQGNFFLIPLGNCDMVLGVQWLSQLGPISWDFHKLTMEFNYQGKMVSLQALGLNRLKITHFKEMKKLITHEKQLALLQVNAVPLSRCNTSCYSLQMQGQGGDKPSHVSEEMEGILQTYAKVFSEPQGLPPSREGHDHQIPLKYGSNPVSLRPYRFPAAQKDIIEKITQELLDNGVLQHSNSSFASPVVLVKKKDGSWRLCVDYRCNTPILQVSYQDHPGIRMLPSRLPEAMIIK
ncbi:uncharacterized protein LOC141605963 [Silene latifolia]|uniref:uncharacterized protein LOC141605963 n=1 Tax=Silene latifolia TaxID=37657 RepID=UPI003D78687B